MRKKLYPFICLILGFFTVDRTVQATTADTNWTEEKIGRIAVKADQAASRKRWETAIRHGEKMLTASASLYPENDINYLNRLKTLNRYYDKADRLTDVPERVERAYALSHSELGVSHHITRLSRLLFYKLLIAQERYTRAIPLVQENIRLLGESDDEKFLKLKYLEQLFSLYGLSGQYGLEEKTLLDLLALNTELMGNARKDNLNIILNLANNYCKQNKVEKYTNLMQEYNLTYTCAFQ